MSNIWKVIIHSCSKPPTSFLSSLHSTSSPSGPSRRGAQPSVTWWPTKWCTFGWTNQPAEPLAEPPMKHWLSEKLQEILDKPLQSKIDMKQENTRFKQQTTLQLEKWLDMVLEVAVVPTKRRLDLNNNQRLDLNNNHLDLKASTLTNNKPMVIQPTKTILWVSHKLQEHPKSREDFPGCHDH